MSENDVKKYVITGAGLILLAPFIPELFERAGCIPDPLNNKTWNKYKALSLLHFLVHGHKTPAASDLYLPQLICNLPVQNLDLSFTDINNQEEDLCLQVLKTVIHQWDKIRYTTVEGLRQNFLQREGKLMIEDDEAHLMVQQRGYDMLINTLPWSVAVTKLNWMHRPLFTTWV